MEVPESTQIHTHVRLKQIELVLFTLCDGSFVFCDVTEEISPEVMYGTTSGYKVYHVGSVQLLELAYLWGPP